MKQKISNGLFLGVLLGGLTCSGMAHAQSYDMPGSTMAPPAVAAAPESDADVPPSGGPEAVIDLSARCDATMSLLSNARQIGGRGYPTLLKMFADTVAMDAITAANGMPLAASRSFLVSATIQVCRGNPAMPLADAAKVSRDQMDRIVAAALSSGNSAGGNE